MKNKILLVGGNGFLGSGIKDELNERDIDYISIDVDDIDLEIENSDLKLIEYLSDITHVVCLAAKIGRTIFNENPIENAKKNERIFNNVINAVKKSSKKYNKKYDFTFYSTSEIFGSIRESDVITINTTPSPTNTPRSIYSKQKLEAESVLKYLYENENVLSGLKIIRPFNVSGKYQKRGVLYEMISDALKNKSIWYSDSTIRSLTSAQYAKKRSVDTILKKSDNIVYENLSEDITIDMYSIAKIIKTVIGDEDIKIIQKQKDNEILIRQTSHTNSFNFSKFKKLKECIDEIIMDFKNDKQ